MEGLRFGRTPNLACSNVVEECLLKWFHLSTAGLPAALSADRNVLTLRLSTSMVNMEPQYVVDIMSGTHDIAPALQQTRRFRLIARVLAGIG